MFLEELLGEPIERIEFITKEDTVSDVAGYHGIRLDVFMKGSKKIYNVEMFSRAYKDYKPLPQRGRYYQGMIDRRSLESGKDYRELPDSYIIFVCDFDYFKIGDALYERVMVIKGHEDIGYDDGSHVYILNSRYGTGNASPAILEFLDCIRKNDVETEYASGLMKKVCSAVKQLREDPDKETMYMVLETMLADERYIGRQEGIEEGRQEGIEEGRQEGLEEGRQEGRQENRLESILNLIEGTGWSVERAMAMLKIPESERPMYLKLVTGKKNGCTHNRHSPFKVTDV